MSKPVKIYYDDIKRETKDLSKNMRSFHNNIKRMLICSVSDKIHSNMGANYHANPVSLLDLACGQLGDLHKWHDAQIGFVWGIEINKNNLYKKSGAMSRYKNFLTKYQDMRVKLTCADASLPLNITKPFNIVSCQFALNYFVDTSDKLNGLLNNVTRALRSANGGYFIGTVIDGLSVYEMLSNKNKVSGDSVWEITREYPMDQEFQEYGQAITMQMSSIGDKPIREYLVNFDYIIKRCGEYGLRLVRSETFDVIYNKKIKPIEEIPLNWEYEIPVLSEAEKQLSFLNRYFIFKQGNM